MADVTDLTAAVDALEGRLTALLQDRDYWRRQHDLVMEDWKADLAQLKDKPRLTDVDVSCRDALGRLLKFFDPTNGAVSSSAGGDLLSNAFVDALRALKECG